MYYINEDVKNLNRIFDQNLREGYLRLDLNENPGGLPEDFIKKTLSKVNQEFISKYPETEPFQRKLAEKLGVTRDNIVLTNGSAEAIRHIFEAFTRPGGKIVSVDPSYAMYEVYAKMYGRNHVKVPYKSGFSVNVQDIMNAIDDETDLVILLNPNNPIGDVYTKEEVEMIIGKAQSHEAFVLIDEAYLYFAPTTFIDYVMQYDHVIMTRTFSKLFSLAGCRLGYAVGKAEDVQLIQKLCTSHNVNAFGILFADSILSEPGMLENMIQLQIEGKKHLVDTLTERGYFVNALGGNFVFIETKTDAANITKRLKDECKILVKHYGSDEYKKYIRVTTGTVDIMDKFIEALIAIDK